jgi:hypothetical protein
VVRAVGAVRSAANATTSTLVATGIDRALLS